MAWGEDILTSSNIPLLARLQSTSHSTSRNGMGERHFTFQQHSSFGKTSIYRHSTSRNGMRGRHSNFQQHSSFGKTSIYQTLLKKWHEGALFSPEQAIFSWIYLQFHNLKICNAIINKDVGTRNISPETVLNVFQKPICFDKSKSSSSHN